MKINLLDIPVLYINLDSDKSEKIRIESMLNDLGFKDVRRVPGVKSSHKISGVAMAHKRALEEGLKLGSPFILLENDVIADNFKEEITIPNDADAYYLGLSVWGLKDGTGVRSISVEKYDKETYRLYNMLGGHAILHINPEYVKFLIKSADFFIKIKTNQDKGRAESMKYWNIYGNVDSIFAQGGRLYPYTSFSLPGPKSFPANRVYLT